MICILGSLGLQLLQHSEKPYVYEYFEVLNPTPFRAPSPRSERRRDSCSTAAVGTVFQISDCSNCGELLQLNCSRPGPCRCLRGIGGAINYVCIYISIYLYVGEMMGAYVGVCRGVSRLYSRTPPQARASSSNACASASPA